MDDVPLEVWRAHSVIIYFRSWKYCFTTINTVNFICMCVYSDGCFIFKPAFAGMFVYVCVYERMNEVNVHKDFSVLYLAVLLNNFPLFLFTNISYG